MNKSQNWYGRPIRDRSTNSSKCFSKGRTMHFIFINDEEDSIIRDEMNDVRSLLRW